MNELTFCSPLPKDTMESKIRARIDAQQSVSREEAEWLFLHGSDSLLQTLACQTRDRYHPRGQVTYLIMSIINFTNVCVAGCKYCSFYKYPHQSGAYTLSHAQICEKLDGLLGYGGTLVSFNAGFHPKLALQDYRTLFEQVHAQYPQLTFFEMTVAEFMFYCKQAKIPYAEGAAFLAAGGTRWITGGGAEILDDAFRRRLSPGKYTAEDYFSAQAAVLQGGLGSTATMVIGFGESLEERMNHLTRLREFQTVMEGRLPSFLCWTYKPYNNEWGGQEISTHEYMRWMAVCRIYLDNFVHIRTSVLTKNEEALQGLLYGANDFDLPIEDEVTQKAGATISMEFDEIFQTAVSLGYTPVHRAPFEVRGGIGWSN